MDHLSNYSILPEMTVLCVLFGLGKNSSFDIIDLRMVDQARRGLLPGAASSAFEIDNSAVMQYALGQWCKAVHM